MLPNDTSLSSGGASDGGTTPAPNDCPPEDPALRSALTALSFWGEGVTILLICVFGLAGNVAAIPVLLSRKMASTFNRLLVFLSVYDSAFLLCAAAESWRRYLAPACGAGDGAVADASLLLFVHFLYQAQNVALVCSTYTTVVLAVERYLAVTRPVEYHLSVVAGGAAGVSPWRRVWRYMAPTLALGVIFNLPKFFEFVTVRDGQDPDEELFTNGTHYFSTTTAASAEEDGDEDPGPLKMVPTRMRLDDMYVFAYVNLGRLLVEGLVPFLSLVFLNSRIHRAIKQRRANQPGGGVGGATSNSSNNNLPMSSTNGRQQQQQQQNDPEESRQSLVLFFIVASFLICNVPRVVLNVYELLTVGRMRDDACFTLPAWVSATAVLSYVLIATNSSVNFFLYCLVNPTFRAEFLERFLPCLAASGGNSQGNGGRRAGGGTPSQSMQASTTTKRSTIKGDDNGTATTPLLIERQVPNHGGCKSPSVAVADASGATVLSPSSGGGGGNSQGAGAV